jgi:hypothetical protein
MNAMPKLVALIGASVMTQIAAAMPDAATDPNIDPQIRPFLTNLNKDSSPFWELPQPKPQETLSQLQAQTPVDMSGVTTTERTITEDGQTVKLYVRGDTSMKARFLLMIPAILATSVATADTPSTSSYRTDPQAWAAALLSRPQTPVTANSIGTTSPVVSKGMRTPVQQRC